MAGCLLTPRSGQAGCLALQAPREEPSLQIPAHLTSGTEERTVILPYFSSQAASLWAVFPAVTWALRQKVLGRFFIRSTVIPTSLFFGI